VAAVVPVGAVLRRLVVVRRRNRLGVDRRVVAMTTTRRRPRALAIAMAKVVGSAAAVAAASLSSVPQ